MIHFPQKETKTTRDHWWKPLPTAIGEADTNRFHPSSILKPSLSSLPSVTLFILALTALLPAEPEAKLVVPEPEAWTGQRLPLFVELRAEGSFTGAASFDLPELPETVIIKVGTPILSSETEGDSEIFVQRHEFALFSQAEGTVPLPPITARFSHRDGYTGPSFDAVVDTAAATLSINRPPDSAELGFLVTTDSLEIDESWDPEPGPVETGAVLKRTITQRANQLTGIALEPAPTPDVDGIRSYPGSPEVTDKTQRGQFLGERRDTITYLVQQPGLHTLPEIRYHWWNPSSQTLESKTLPSVSFTATAPPPPPPKPSPARFLWPIVATLLAGVIFIYRKKLLFVVHRLYEKIDPPSKRARRSFLRACSSNNATEASRTWGILRQLDHDIRISDQLRDEILSLQRQIYGSRAAGGRWSGQALAESYLATRKRHRASTRRSELPPLNP